MIGLGQDDEIVEITLRPEIWYYDAIYHEAHHCMKWQHSDNVHIFWSQATQCAVVLWTSCVTVVSGQGTLFVYIAKYIMLPL